MSPNSSRIPTLAVTDQPTIGMSQIRVDYGEGRTLAMELTRLQDMIADLGDHLDLLHNEFAGIGAAIRDISQRVHTPWYTRFRNWLKEL